MSCAVRLSVPNHRKISIIHLKYKKNSFISIIPRKTVQNGVCLGKIKPSLLRLNFAKLFVIPPRIFHVCAIEQNRMPRKFAKQKGLFTGCFIVILYAYFPYICACFLLIFLL